MPDKKDKTPEVDRNTIPDTPKAKIESQPAMPAVKAEEAEKAREKAAELLQAQQENKAHTIKSHVMGLVLLRRWMDSEGNDVGLVGPEGKPLRAELEKSLLRTGILVQPEQKEVLPEKLQKNLEKAAGMLPPDMSLATGAILRPIEKQLDEMTAKIADLETNPNYLLDFKRGGELRGDITQVLHLMNDTRGIYKSELATSDWVHQNNAAQYFSNLGTTSDKRYEMDTALREKYGEDIESVSEFAARAELNEEARSRIRQLAEQDGDPLEIARRMSALMGDQLQIMFNSISGQLTLLFDQESFELGDTDAESMLTAIHSLNNCIEALRDMRKTKEVIPTLK